MSTQVFPLNQGAFTRDNINALLAGDFVIHSANGAINPSLPGRRLITKAGVAALTLAAPVSGLDDGKLIQFFSTTANAHTITATGLLKTGSAAVNVATFGAFPGASLTLMAYQGLWYVAEQNAVTFT